MEYRIGSIIPPNQTVDQLSANGKCVEHLTHHLRSCGCIRNHIGILTILVDFHRRVTLDRLFRLHQLVAFDRFFLLETVVFRRPVRRPILVNREDRLSGLKFQIVSNLSHASGLRLTMSSETSASKESLSESESDIETSIIPSSITHWISCNGILVGVVALSWTTDVAAALLISAAMSLTGDVR